MARPELTKRRVQSVGHFAELPAESIKPGGCKWARLSVTKCCVFLFAAVLRSAQIITYRHVRAHRCFLSVLGVFVQHSLDKSSERFGLWIASPWPV